MSLFEKRIASLGISEAQNRIEIYDPEAEFPHPERSVWEIFREDKATGDIRIAYYTVDGQPIRYTWQGSGKTAALNASERFYETRRLAQPKGDMKYQMPEGQPTLPWFPPTLVEKYQNRTRIETLILTEGVFKAMAGSLDGLDVVGLPSVTCYKDRDGRLYSDVRRLIETCEVQNVVVLWDGDCLNVSKKDIQVGDEATNRPAMFFNSAKKIAELVRKLQFEKNRECPSVFFAHVRSDAHAERPKGLDDLLIVATDEQKNRIRKEITTRNEEGFFFKIFNITTTTSALYRYFLLDKKDAESFYFMHRDVIEGREYKFHGSLYGWSETENKLIMRSPEWANRVKWVGDEFFLDDIVPGAYGETRRLIPYKQGQFTKMFGDNFWQHLCHHRAFVNIPDHFNFQQVIERENGARYYNRYFPFPHVPKEGSWGTIMQLLLHLFGTKPVRHGLTGKEYAPVDLALDYIQLLLTKPTQMLPVLCFYSPENNTGKSTFGKLMMSMFGDNAVPIGNADLQSDFNDIFTDKLLAICEETLLERKRDAERIKAMSTAEKVTVNPKGQKQFTIDFFTKFIFTSNNIRMLYVSKHDQRYWIVRVPVIATENPNMLEEMRAELPAFTHHLMQRQMVTEKEGRMWFHHSLIRTEILSEMVTVNEPSDATNLREQIREWFVADPELNEIRMTLKEVREEFFSKSATAPWVQEILKDYLQIDLARDAAGTRVYERGCYYKLEPCFNAEGEHDLRKVKKPYRGNPYVFRREVFLREGEIAYETASKPPAEDSANGVGQAFAEAEQVPF